MAFDTIIIEGTVVDGSGKARYESDIGINDGKISAIGDLSRAETRRTIDATGTWPFPASSTCTRTPTAR